MPGIGSNPTHSAARLPHASQRIRRRYHVGAAGWLYVFITVFVALGAFNSQNNLLFWTFGFALALLIVSGIMSGWMLMGIRVHRELIAPASVGEHLRTRYRVTNINRLVPAFALTIVDSAQTPASGAQRPNMLDMLLGRRPRPVQPKTDQVSGFAAYVPPRRSVQVDASALAHKRGPISFSTIQVHTSFPFGLIRKSLTFDLPAQSFILPRIGLAPSLDGLSGHAWTSSGKATRRHGRSEEFYSLRDYAPGDTQRQIAWRASARRGALLVRQFAATAPNRLYIVLRLRSRIGADMDDEAAISMAAAIAQNADRSGIDCALIDPLTRLHIHAGHGEAHLQRTMRALGLLDLGPDDGRGERTIFPARLIPPNTRVVVVHAGQVDRSFTHSQSRIEHVGTAPIERSAQTATTDAEAPTPAFRAEAS